jgi:hypothetical protein
MIFLRVTRSPGPLADLAFEVDARALERDPLDAMREALARVLPNPIDSMNLASATENDHGFDAVYLHDGSALRLAIGFGACPLSAFYPNHRCPECRVYLDEDAHERCKRCGAHLNI